jgi:hypothetical protein
MNLGGGDSPRSSGKYWQAAERRHAVATQSPLTLPGWGDQAEQPAWPKQGVEPEALAIVTLSRAKAQEIGKLTRLLTNVVSKIAKPSALAGLVKERPLEPVPKSLTLVLI